MISFVEFIKNLIGFLGQYRLVAIIFYVLSGILLLYCVKTILMLISNGYVRSKKEVLYRDHIDITSKCNKIGDKLLENYDTYEAYCNDIGFNRVCDCSASIVSNASKNPLKYLIKYSDIDYDLFCLERLDYCIEYVENLDRLNSQFEALNKLLLKDLPIWVRLFVSKDKMPYWVCDVNLLVMHYEEPYFTFLYISPGKRSQQEFNIVITSDLLIKVRERLSERIGYKGHSKSQRSAMTNDLREAIKQRDHYTCCICGNSVYNEPNLLLEVDHIIPISKGGKTEADNLQTLCWRCNRKKGNSI